MTPNLLLGEKIDELLAKTLIIVDFWLGLTFRKEVKKFAFPFSRAFFSDGIASRVVFNINMKLICNSTHLELSFRLANCILMDNSCSTSSNFGRID